MIPWKEMVKLVSAIVLVAMVVGLLFVLFLWFLPWAAYFIDSLPQPPGGHSAVEPVRLFGD